MAPGQTQEFAETIISAIESGKITKKEQLNRLKLAEGKRLGIGKMPSNPDILAYAEEPSQKLGEMLSIKPLRTLSGVAPVAIMTKPISCPHGTCIYCPGGPNSFFGSVPQSYTGNEPATMRAIDNSYDAYLQTINRLSQYYATAHNPQKLELIIMGGTFPSFPQEYQNEFISNAFQAANDFSELFIFRGKFSAKKFNEFFSKGTHKKFSGAQREKMLAMKKPANVEREHNRNENAAARIVAMCIETKPDWSKQGHINQMLELGTTRVELGVQSIYNEVLRYTNRGHTIEDSVEATRLLKDSGLKVTYHIMPGQPKSSKEKDIEMFRELFQNPDFRPDGLKIYPCMVMPGTALAQLYKNGKFTPLNTDEAAEIIAESERYVPEYARIHRIQRDIPTKLALAGVDKNNLRQIVDKKILQKGINAREIRARESGINALKGREIEGEAKLAAKEYLASKGEEVFISFEDEKNDLLLGFCRLRNPFEPFRKEFDSNTACIRELHVFGNSLALGEKSAEKSGQHTGLGKRLVEEAEKIASEKFGAKKMLVISGVGAREYYSKKLEYTREGRYMAKKI